MAADWGQFPNFKRYPRRMRSKLHWLKQRLSGVFLFRSSTASQGTAHFPLPHTQLKEEFKLNWPTESCYGCRFEHRGRKGAASRPLSRGDKQSAGKQQSVREKMAGSDSVFSAGTNAGDGVELLGSYPEFGCSRFRLHQVRYSSSGAVGSSGFRSLAAVYVVNG